MLTSSVYSMTIAWIFRIAAQSDYLLCSLRNRGAKMNCTLSSCTSIISSTCLFRAPFDHLTSSSTQTRPDIRRPIRGEERATRSNTSGNSGDQSPAPRAGRVQVSVSVSDMNLFLKSDFHIKSRDSLEKDEQRGGERTVPTAKHARPSPPIQ